MIDTASGRPYGNPELASSLLVAGAPCRTGEPATAADLQFRAGRPTGRGGDGHPDHLDPDIPIGVPSEVPMPGTPDVSSSEPTADDDGDGGAVPESAADARSVASRAGSVVDGCSSRETRSTRATTRESAMRYV